MKVRVEEDTLNALVSLAESAIAEDAHDKADLKALQDSVADETDLKGDLKNRINALVTSGATTTPDTSAGANAQAATAAPASDTTSSDQTSTSDPTAGVPEPGTPTASGMSSVPPGQS